LGEVRRDWRSKWGDRGEETIERARRGETRPSRAAASAAASGEMFSGGAWTVKYCKGGLSLFSTSDTTPAAGTAFTSPTSATRPTAAAVVSENFILEFDE